MQESSMTRTSAPRIRLGHLLPLLLAASVAGPATAKQPEPVTVGTYVNQIYGVDLKNNSFSIDFYLWFRWSDDNLKPMDTVQLVNGRILTKTLGRVKKLDGVNMASARIVATVTKFWNMSRFPLDKHDLAIELEDSSLDGNVLVYLSDKVYSGLSDEVQVPGWKITGTFANVGAHVYKVRPRRTLEQADSTQPTGMANYSRYTFSTKIERPGYGRFIKIFLSLFVSILVSYLAFFVRPKDLSPRVGLGTGAIFAVAAAASSINNMLPENATITMADRLTMAALGCIAASILGTIVSTRLTYSGKDAASHRFDRVCSRVFPFVYVAAFVACLWH
jgi:hypothetical protein